MVHAATRRRRQKMIDAYGEFEAAYRLANELLRFRSVRRRLPAGVLEAAPADPWPRLTCRRRLTQRLFDALILIRTGEVCLDQLDLSAAESVARQPGLRRGLLDAPPPLFPAD